MRNLVIGLIAWATFTIVSCSNNTNNKQVESAPAAENSTDGTAVGTFSNLLSNYLALTNALTTDNDQEAGRVAENIISVLSTIKSASLTSEERADYADISDDIKENAEHIAHSVGKIEHQREHLVMLSADMYDLAKLFGTAKPLYKMFCPMYKDSEGAFWLSDSEEVRNPYFGAEMLTCGEVQEEIK